MVTKPKKQKLTKKKPKAWNSIDFGIQKHQLKVPLA